MDIEIRAPRDEEADAVFASVCDFIAWPTVAIRVVAGGEALLAPTVTRRLIELFATLPAPRPVHASVTKRERDVLRAVARGLANHEIAEALHLGYGTVKTHVSSLLLKLGCRDRAQLVMYAYETGLAVPGATP